MTQTVLSPIKPNFVKLAAMYPRKSVSQKKLYEEIGIGELAGNPAYENTCGIRMSYALTRSGLFLKRGGLRINRGPYRGKRIEPGMRKLAEQLTELLGPPEEFRSEQAAKKQIGMRKGVIAFFFDDNLPLLGAQGHIDLVWPNETGFYQCLGSCFFSPRGKIWFWPLD